MVTTTNNRVNLVQVCSLNIEQSRLLQYLDFAFHLGEREKGLEKNPGFLYVTSMRGINLQPVLTVKGGCKGLG